MNDFARLTVYKIGRLTIVSAVVCAAGIARAQEAPAAPTPPLPEGALAAAPEAPAAAPPAAPPAVPAPPDPAVTARIDSLEQRTQTLEKQLGAAEAAANAPRSTTTFQTDEGGFAVTSADRQYQIRFKGVLQVDGRRIFDNTPLANSVDTFIVRRARPILAGTVLGLTDFMLEPDFGNNTVTLFSAYADTHPFPWLRLRVGKFKGPVGLERLQSDTDLVFVERALSQNLSPQREVGVELWGDVAGWIVR
jgi:phosphate-selective porin OprO/OprP